MSFREFSDYREWESAVEDMGHELVPPYADVENGPSPDDIYDPTIAVDRIAGEEVGVWENISYDENGVELDSGYGILFDNPNDFARWSHDDVEYPWDGDPISRIKPRDV